MCVPAPFARESIVDVVEDSTEFFHLSDQFHKKM